MEASKKPRALVVDSDPLVCRVIAVTLEDAGFDVLTSCSLGSAFEIAQKQRPAAAVIDLSTGDRGSLALAIAVRRENPEARCVAMTHGERFEDGTMTSAAREAGYRAVLVKPFGRKSLIEAVMVRKTTMVPTKSSL